jgi:hypothetical protein
LFGKNPVDLDFYVYQGAVGTWFSWQNTLPERLLEELRTALPSLPRMSNDDQ